MIIAGIYGLIGGAALFIGALFGIYVKNIPKGLVGVIMAFGSGVLISALTFNLMEKAYQSGGLNSVSIGFISGALLFVGGDYLIDSCGGYFRKIWHGERYIAKKGTVNNSKQVNSGFAIFLGAILDGIPESAAIGIGLAAGKGIGLSMLVAVFLSNLPEGISGALGMKKSGKSNIYIMTVWCITIAICSGAAMLGYSILGDASPDIIAITLALAAGAILAMIADTMMPEAFEEGGRFVALVTATGFLLTFIVSHMAK
ncbi:MAG: ZIP family zinc transporter [Peptostreptococcaceae bacterium]|nr:ZIP family zinc transporter [Peptostreptococcaceae bacterium]